MRGGCLLSHPCCYSCVMFIYVCLVLGCIASACSLFQLLFIEGFVRTPRLSRSAQSCGGRRSHFAVHTMQTHIEIQGKCISELCICITMHPASAASNCIVHLDASAAPSIIFVLHFDTTLPICILCIWSSISRLIIVHPLHLVEYLAANNRGKHGRLAVQHKLYLREKIYEIE